MGFRLIRITTDILISLLRFDGIGKKKTFTAEGLPADAEIVDVDQSDLCLYGQLTLKVQSKEWPAMMSGQAIPILEIKVRSFNYDYPNTPNIIADTPQFVIAGLSR